MPRSLKPSAPDMRLTEHEQRCLCTGTTVLDIVSAPKMSYSQLGRMYGCSPENIRLQVVEAERKIVRGLRQIMESDEEFCQYMEVRYPASMGTDEEIAVARPKRAQPIARKK